MKKELEQKLFETYPDLFPGGRDVDQTKSLMCYGFECGDGWYDILNNLCWTISHIVKGFKWANKIITPVVVVQVKEKFGTLRFYYDGGDWVDKTTKEFIQHCDYIDGAIMFAEDLSEKTCEYCGKPGVVRTDGWWKCLCDECDQKRKEKRKSTN